MSLLWLVWRALIAITLMLGYYVLGITLGGGLIYLSYYLFSFDDIFLRGLFYVCSCAGTVICSRYRAGTDSMPPVRGSSQRSSRGYLKP